MRPKKSGKRKNNARRKWFKERTKEKEKKWKRLNRALKCMIK
jgi:hypothetical protein